MLLVRFGIGASEELQRVDRCPDKLKSISSVQQETFLCVVSFLARGTNRLQDGTCVRHMRKRQQRTSEIIDLGLSRRQSTSSLFIDAQRVLRYALLLPITGSISSHPIDLFHHGDGPCMEHDYSHNSCFDAHIDNGAHS